MPLQVVYETNADWTASYEAMVKNPLVVADPTEKGLLWFKFKENQTVFQLSPMGNLQVKWTDESEKRTLFRLIKNLLVAKSNENLRITPKKQQVWIEYPVPDSFKLYWCDEVTEFERKRLGRLPETNQRAGIKPIGQCAPKKGNWDHSPRLNFFVTQERPPLTVQLPMVAFNIENLSDYKLVIRLEVTVLLGGRNLGLVEDTKGYYCGKVKIQAEPNSVVFGNGCFTVPKECALSEEEFSLEVQAILLDENDPNKGEYTIVKSWTYMRGKNAWYYEPTALTDGSHNLAELTNSWDSLKNTLARIGGYLTEIEVEKRRSDETYCKITVKGIMMLKGAKTMQAAAKMCIPDEYEAFLFTESSLDKNDKLTWQGNTFRVKDIEDIYDVYSLSYRIAKLFKPPLDVEPAWVFGD
jgi:hypothetical protein